MLSTIKAYYESCGGEAVACPRLVRIRDSLFDEHIACTNSSVKIDDISGLALFRMTPKVIQEYADLWLLFNEDLKTEYRSRLFSLRGKGYLCSHKDTNKAYVLQSPTGWEGDSLWKILPADKRLDKGKQINFQSKDGRMLSVKTKATKLDYAKGGAQTVAGGAVLMAFGVPPLFVAPVHPSERVYVCDDSSPDVYGSNWFMINASPGGNDLDDDSQDKNQYVCFSSSGKALSL